jgi:hypothetical protein
MHFEIRKKKKKYSLVFPSVATNRVTGDDIKKDLEAADTGIQLQQSLEFLDLKFTNFNVSRGNMNDDIYERMAQTGCIPQPRGIVCTKCGYNIYDEEDSILEGCMGRHYTSKHNRWCKDNGMEQFFRLYGPNCSGKFTSINGITEFDYFQTGMYYCKKLSCQKINSKKASDLQHLHGVHGYKWDAWEDMNPFWRMLKIILKENVVVRRNMVKIRKTAYLSFNKTYMDIGNELLDNAIKGDVQLDATDSDYIHLMTRQRKRIGNIEVVDLPTKKK